MSCREFRFGSFVFLTYFTDFPHFASSGRRAGRYRLVLFSLRYVCNQVARNSQTLNRNNSPGGRPNSGLETLTCALPRQFGQSGPGPTLTPRPANDRLRADQRGRSADRAGTRLSGRGTVARLLLETRVEHWSRGRVRRRIRFRARTYTTRVHVILRRRAAQFYFRPSRPGRGSAERSPGLDHDQRPDRGPFGPAGIKCAEWAPLKLFAESNAASPI